EDTIPSENTSEHPIEAKSLAPIIEEDVVPVQRSARVWKLVDLPPSAKVVKRKWIYKKNTDMDGVVYIYKAHLVAKGFTQTYGADYEETFSPDIRAIRILIAIAAYYDYEIWQINVKTTFLNGFLDEKIYMEQPEGFVDLDHPRKNVPYASAVGSIMYAVRYTRPYVAFAQNITSRFQQSPGEAHWTAVKNIFKYLRRTKDMFLVYGGNSDAELQSSKQSTTAQHAAEAEYIAAAEATKEAIWIRKFVDELGVVPSNNYPIEMNCNNTDAISIAKEPGIIKGARHFQRKFHYVRECVKTGEIKMVKVHTDDNL
nr:hypothetical protein [Tanacetum cinerariifolium]